MADSATGGVTSVDEEGIVADGSTAADAGDVSSDDAAATAAEEGAVSSGAVPAAAAGEGVAVIAGGVAERLFGITVCFAARFSTGRACGTAIGSVVGATASVP
jgi:hypothetical protein